MVKQAHSWAKWTASTALAAVAVIGGGIATYSVHFANRALPQTSVVGVSVVGQTHDEIASEIASRAADTRVTVTVDEQTAIFTLAELGIAVDSNAMADQALAENEPWWSRIAASVSPRDISTISTNDQSVAEAFDARVAALAGDPSANAAVNVDGEGNDARFVASESHMGRSIDATRVDTAVDQATSTLSDHKVDLTSVEVAPSVTTEQAQATADTANKLLAVDLTVGGDVTKHTATAADKASWVAISSTDEGLGAPAFDPAKITQWVKDQGEASNDKPVDGIHNVNAAGQVVATASEGTKGWSVNNADQVAADAVAALQAGQSYQGHFTYDPVDPGFTTRPIAQGAENLPYPAAEGEKWIDVNLSDHTATAYEGTSVVHGPVAMVNGMPQRPTVTGTFHVMSKVASDTMKGTDLDGSKYETKNVPWAMYFADGGYALHGAYWRSTFGYAGSQGSHGCVNLPVSQAKWFYDWADIGAPVTSHD